MNSWNLSSSRQLSISVRPVPFWQPTRCPFTPTSRTRTQGLQCQTHTHTHTHTQGHKGKWKMENSWPLPPFCRAKLIKNFALHFWEPVTSDGKLLRQRMSERERKTEREWDRRREVKREFSWIFRESVNCISACELWPRLPVAVSWIFSTLL